MLASHPGSHTGSADRTVARKETPFVRRGMIASLATYTVILMFYVTFSLAGWQFMSSVFPWLLLFAGATVVFFYTKMLVSRGF